LIFYTKNNAKPWDGKFNGMLQASGAYVYVVDIKDEKEIIERNVDPYTIEKPLQSLSHNYHLNSIQSYFHAGIACQHHTQIMNSLLRN